MIPSLASIDRADVARNGLHRFVQLAWPHVVDSEPFVDNWHIEEVCRELELVSSGETITLVINIPPGCMKSLLTSVFWPVWEWIDRPEKSFVFASYDQGIPNRDAERSIKLLRSQWFIDRWGSRLHPTRALASSNFENTKGGYRFGTTVRGALTGRHFDYRGLDDPLKPLEADSTAANFSRTTLERVDQWLRNTWPTRVKNPSRPSQVITMQRLHTEDPAGIVLATGKARHVCFPMRYDAAVASAGDRRTEHGELLFPERFPESFVADTEEAMGPITAAAQYQQQPTAAGGAVFQLVEWGVRWWAPKGDKRIGTTVEVEIAPTVVIKGEVIEAPREGQQFQSWDLTFKDSEGSDMVAGGVWCAVPDQDGKLLHYLLDIHNRRLSFVGTKNAFRSWATKWPDAHIKLVEDKANGPAIENDLKGEVAGIVLVDPKGGKLARASASTPPFAVRRVVFPLPDLLPGRIVIDALVQLIGFPRVKYDDLVDMMSQALTWSRKSSTMREALWALSNQRGASSKNG